MQELVTGSIARRSSSTLSTFTVQTGPNRKARRPVGGCRISAQRKSQVVIWLALELFTEEGFTLGSDCLSVRARFWSVQVPRFPTVQPPWDDHPWCHGGIVLPKGHSHSSDVTQGGLVQESTVPPLKSSWRFLLLLYSARERSGGVDVRRR